MNRRWACRTALGLALMVRLASAAAADEPLEFFERHVRPVLVENCQSCHGPAKQHGGLRVDSRESLLAGGDRGPAMDLAHPEKSLLLEAVRQADPDLQMPPKPAAKLADAAIAAVENWIAAGAPWPAEATAKGASTPSMLSGGASHWAFQPLKRDASPTVNDHTWPQSPLDRFVLAKLEAAGMEPAPAAERGTLLRRVTLDLIGLPPSEDDIARFVADQNPDAWERVVDRLLDSPHYGERWGRYWLDVARFADTKGYVRLAEERRFHYAFTYRDYVVRAFNEDLPYDRFVLEQLAADQLPNAEQRSLAAMGFLTLGRRFTGNKHDVIDDRIDVVTRGLLGLTVTCARCHDHKYDPIPTADYYALYGVFAPGEDPIVPALLAAPPGTPEGQAFAAEFEKRKRALEEYEQPQYQALLDEFRARSGDYLAQAIEGRQPPQQPLPAAPGEIRQWVVERWIDYLEQAGPADAVFAPWHAFAALPADAFAEAAKLVMGSWPADNLAATNDASVINPLVREYFRAHPPRSMADVARGYGELLSGAHRRWHDLVASHAAAGSGAPEKLSDSAEQLRRVLYAADSPVAVGQHDALFQYLYDNAINNEVMSRRNAVYQHLADTAHAPPRAHTLFEAPALHDPRILVRGNPTRPGRSVPRHFLSALCRETPATFAAATARWQLARAIVDPANPLTARVLVNRVWAHHFGAGLVRTPSNFGTRGEAPTHPELLDYLAARFMDEGWSIKKLHRWILLSSTYQQACSQRADYRTLDPENRLLWTANRRRLDFEALRDSLLAVSGRLDLTLGGPSVELASPSATRRTLYGVIDRQALPGMFATFDFASPDTHTAARHSTTVPQQALFLMNSPLVIDLAKALAARTASAEDDPAARFGRMTRLAWGRAPTEREARMAVDFIAADQGSDAAGMDAWTALAQTVLLSNEMLYVE